MRRLLVLLLLLACTNSFSVAQDCEIVFGGSLTLLPPEGNLGQSAAPVSQQTQFGYDLFMHHVVEQKGPFQVGDQLCTVRIKVIPENGTPASVRAAYEELVNDPEVDFFLGPTTSTLSLQARAVTEAAGRILIGTTAAADAFVAGGQYTFNTLPRGSKAFDLALVVLALDRAHTISMIVHEDDALSVSGCSKVESVAASLGMTVRDRYAIRNVTDTPSQDAAAALDYLEHNNTLFSDVLVVCALNTLSIAIVDELQVRNELPNAVALFPFTGGWPVSPLRPYMLATTQWSPEARFPADDWYGSNQEFQVLFKELNGVAPDVGGMTGALAPIMLLNAILTGGSLETSDVLFALSRTSMATFAYGETTYGVDNAITASNVVLQFDQNGSSHVVAPLQAATSPVVYPIPKWDERTYNPDFFQYTSEIVMAVLAGVGAAISVILMVFVAAMHSRPAIHAAGMLFCEVILLGSLFLYAAEFTWMIYQNDGTCAALPWLLCCGFVLIFGTMVMKTWRIRRVFHNPKLKRVEITNLYLMACVGTMLAVQLLLLVLWTAIDARSVTMKVVDPDRPVLDELECSWSTVDIVFASLIAAYWSVIILTGLVLAFLIRSVTYTLYNESKLIAFSVYNMFFFILLILIIEVVPIDDQQTVFIVRSLALILATFITVMVLFVPKVYYVLSNKSRDSGTHSFRSTLTTSSSSLGSPPRAVQVGSTQSSSVQLQVPCPTCGRKYLALENE
mmetsp:Transcript_43184/g.109073  ORF Transcript_43184/g.109073 Transcript_43184/m.109073 type:complete len:734 (+) Transcript_43184:161-2362(+)